MNKYPRLQQAYSFKNFEKQGKKIVSQLSAHLEASQQSEKNTNNWRAPFDELSFWQSYQFENIHTFVDDLLQHSIHLHNPKYMGHQVSVPAPLSALTNLISGILNNGMAVYEMGQAATAIERIVVDLFCSTIGYDETSNGMMTSGGTLANLTALLAARQAIQGCDVWQDGADERLAVLVSNQAHYSVDRAARVMGLGAAGVVLVDVDASFSMDKNALELAYKATVDKGFKVIAVVASACSTSTGIYDDLQIIGEFCKQQDVWFHVDGAHGGAAVFSKKHKTLLKGIEMADSVIVDTHKMMMTPTLSTVVLFKDKIKGAQIFHQKAQYLFADKDIEEQWYEGGLRTFECTKLMMCLKFYVLWKTYGVEIFEENVDCLYGLGEKFASMLDSEDNFELALSPQTNIVCFRYIKQGYNEKQLNELNKTIRQKLLEDSEFYIVQTVLDGTHYLRVTLMNPMTTETHLHSLLKKIRASY